MIIFLPCNGYRICYEQTSINQTPCVYYTKAGDLYSSVELTSEMIKTQRKEPSAVVLKQNDLLVMTEEFLNEIVEHVIE